MQFFFNFSKIFKKTALVAVCVVPK